MNILHLSTYDCQQGAAKAAWRLHDALREFGHNSRMFVAEKATEDPDVIEVPKVPGWIRSLQRRMQHFLPGVDSSTTGVGWFDSDAPSRYQWKKILKCDCDVLVVHITRSFIPVKSLASIADKLGVPVVYVPVDISPFTGGCHHHMDCDGFRKSCGNCPQLIKSGERDVSRKTWMKKKKYLRPLDITFVTPTRWLEKRLSESSLYCHHPSILIPLSVDTNVYYPLGKVQLKSNFGISASKKIIFFGAHSLTDPRKGFRYLIEALGHLSRISLESVQVEDIVLLVAGKSELTGLAGLPYEVVRLGYVDESTLADAYRAADVFVCPSVYDAGPMMIPEAMICGTPVVAFNDGGAPDLIKSGRNGYLANVGDSTDLANGLLALLEDAGLPDMSRMAAADALARHRPSAIARQYQVLFEGLIYGDR